MKTISILLIVVSLSCRAQDKEQVVKESDVPGDVKQSFAKRFPGATGVKWTLERANEFEVEFKSGKMRQSSTFDPAGKWMATETEIRKSDLPEAVQAAISREFQGYKIDEAEKAETPEQGTFYEVALEQGKSDFELQISPAGIVLKKLEKQEKGDND